MKRIFLTDGSYKWFDYDKADRLKEETWHDGRNFISKATGSQTEHEALIITKGGRFIIKSWSDWQGTTENYNEIDRDEAVMWLAKNDYAELAESFDNDDILGGQEI